VHRLVALTALCALVLAGPQRASAQVTYDVLYTFTGTTATGSHSALVQGTDGNFYGTTSNGGAANVGTVYRMTASGDVTVLHEFAGGSSDGATPLAALIQARDGNFYGTTSAGGTANAGTVFRMTPSGTVMILHDFVGGSGDGATPQAPLIQATDGNLYGTTTVGGSLDVGTAFRMTPFGETTLLHSFTGPTSSCTILPSQQLPPCPPEGTEGRFPAAALIQASDGNFYGITSGGGGTNSPSTSSATLLNGTIFRMTPGGVVTTLKSFVYGITLCCRGSFPRGSLVQAIDGNLYGRTSESLGSSSHDSGTVFRLNPINGGFAIVGEGGQTNSNLIQATDWNFYGQSWTSFNGSAVFRITPRGVRTVLHVGASNQVGSTLLQAADGNFYGTLDGPASLDPGAASVFRLSAGLPAPTSQPSSQAVRAGEPTGFVAFANLFPLSAYRWQVSSDHGGTWTNIVDGGPYTGATTPHLYVTPPTRGFDGFQFRLVATTATETVTSSAAVLSVQAKVANDVDGDFKADLVLFRPQSGIWFYSPVPVNPFSSPSKELGKNGDVPVTGDYDGDGTSDLAVFRPVTGTWFVLRSSSASAVPVTYQWGLSTDLPVPGDYDGDGKTDLAVYRPSTGIWYIARSSTNYTTATTLALGLSTDIPVPADFDGDGVTDIAVYRPSTGTWFVRQSGALSSFIRQWGAAGDVPVPGDYDGDGRADLAVWRPSNGVWYIRESSTSFATTTLVPWGAVGDVPVPGDYDGDGKMDVAVFRPPNWWIVPSTATYATQFWRFGTDGDLPSPNATVAYALAAAAARPTVSTLANLLRSGDMDADGKVDLTVWRPSSGTWLTAHSGANYTTSATLPWGLPTDLPVTGDYDGDGKTDVAVYRPSTGVWYLVQSTTNFTTSTSTQWGIAGDVPVPGDYDGDGKTDVAVYRPSTGVWYILLSSVNFTTSLGFQWGVNGDLTAPGDYDGDGVTDIAVFRPSTGVWYILQSTSSYTTSVAYQFGQSGDVTVPGDYDGDGKSDIAVYRPSTGTWFIKQSSTSNATSVSFLFGLTTDIPVPGDFDGDGKTDIAVWRPSTGVWSVLQSRTNFTTASSVQWGASGDVPSLKRP
jgi:uncharacterized repeat protein (TIGR03803 family)